MLGGLLVAVVGGFVLWLQAGLLYSVASLGLGGLGLQAHLTSAADGVQAGDYETARAEYEEAVAAAQLAGRTIATAAETRARFGLEPVA